MVASGPRSELVFFNDTSYKVGWVLIHFYV